MKQLLSADIKAPAGTTFKRKNIGVTSFELPAGQDWTMDENYLDNSKTEMIIIITSQMDGFQDMQKEYMDSYIQNNEIAAPNWKTGDLKFGTVNQLPAGILTGTFNNGTQFITKDFIFYDKSTTTILQARVPEASKDQLEPIVDYIASTYRCHN